MYVLLMPARELCHPVLVLVLVVAHDGADRRIYESAAVSMHSSLGHARQFDASLRENVHDGFTSSDEIVGNDASMAPPPHGLRAHDRASLCMSCLA